MKRVPFNIPKNSKLFLGLRTVIKSGSYSRSKPKTAHIVKLLQKKLEKKAEIYLTTSCTHAIELALVAGGLQPGDEVIIPDFNFLSSSSIALNLGAIPVFVDIKKETLCLDEIKLTQSLTDKTKFVVVTTYNANSPNLNFISDFCKDNNLILILDNAHSLGGSHNHKSLSSYGDFSVLSFHETKNIQCGEGGALLVNNPIFHQTVDHCYYKGSNRSSFDMGSVSKYEWIGKGSSYGMSEILSAILVPQVKKLEKINRKRVKLCNLYRKHLLDWSFANEFIISSPIENNTEVGHIFYIIFKTEKQRETVRLHLKEEGIIALSHYHSIYNSVGGQKFSKRYSDISISPQISKTILRLPLYYSLTPLAVSRISNKIKSIKI